MWAYRTCVGTEKVACYVTTKFSEQYRKIGVLGGLEGFVRYYVPPGPELIFMLAPGMIFDKL